MYKYRFMRKILVLRYLAFFLIVSLGVAPPVSAKGRLAGPTLAHVDKIIDGDTIHVTVDVWLDMALQTKVRLAAVDTPELNNPRCEREQRLAQDAKNFVERFLAARRVYLKDVRHGKYAGRVVARVETAGGRDLGQALMEAGLGKPYGVGASWCAES